MQGWKPTDRCFNITDIFNKSDNISYKYCISGKGITDIQKRKIAFRQAVLEQIYTYKNKYFEKYNQCEICNKIIKNDENTHIDHNGIYEFRHIFDMFKEECKLVYFHQTPTISYYIIEDEIIRNRWQDFHKKYAKLQCVCIKCNSIKSKH